MSHFCRLTRSLKRGAHLVAVLALTSTGLSAQSTQTVYEYSLPNGYDFAGNVPAMNDTVTGSWTLGYDALNRLTEGSVSAGSYAGISFTATYDTFGNRLTQSVSTGSSSATGVPQTSYTTPDANNRLAASSFTQMAGSYDASGNMTENDNLLIRYDGEGRVCAVSNKAGGITHYGYDAEGRRVTKSTGGNLSCSGANAGGTLTSQFLLGALGEQVTELDGSGNWQHTNVFANGALLATYDSAGLHFAQTDPIGTVRARVKALDPSSGVSGLIEQFCQSFPFGDGLYCDAPDASEQHFTGKERDQESGLDNFGARYYGSNMGRFMSPDYSDDQDPVPFANFSNPQSMNLYSYALNNPISNSDDSGHDVNVCTNDSSGNQQCTLLSNEQYSAATQGNGSLNVPSLNSVGMNGSGNITDGSGNTVGTASYVSNGGFDYYGNQSFYNQLSNTSQVVKAGTALYAGAYAGVAGGLFAYAGATGALGGGAISLNITGVAQASALALPAGGKVAQIMARAGPEFRGDPAKLLSYLKDLVSQAVAAGTYVQTGVGTMYRAGSDYIVVNGGVITSYVKNADPSWGRPLTYAAAGGK